MGKIEVERATDARLEALGVASWSDWSCDAETLSNYHRNRPNPLMPSELPTLDDDTSAASE